MILMCKDNEVFDTENEKVLNEKLLPGYMKKLPCKEAYNKWIAMRYNLSSNSLARKLRGLTFGQGNREKINIETRMLSLSDCYWLKEKDETITFAEISPYHSYYWTGEKEYEGGAIPTLYVNGALSKEWLSNGNLYKQGDLGIELLCIELCKKCEIDVEDGILREDGIELINFTSEDVMLEQANMSGKIHPEEFTTSDIIKMFGMEGVQMITIDAIIGNGDRHAGNFGYLRDANTGEYIKMAPLYDFDHALDSKQYEKEDFLIKELLEIKKPCYVAEIKRICDVAKDFSHEIFSNRANLILKKIALEENLLKENSSKTLRGRV